MYKAITANLNRNVFKETTIVLTNLNHTKLRLVHKKITTNKLFTKL